MNLLPIFAALAALSVGAFAMAAFAPTRMRRQDEKRTRATEQGRINAILAKRVADLESRQDHSARQLGGLLRDKAQRVRGETLTAQPDETLTAILEEVRGLRADLAQSEDGRDDGSYTITCTSLDGRTTKIKRVKPSPKRAG